MILARGVIWKVWRSIAMSLELREIWSVDKSFLSIGSGEVAENFTSVQNGSEIKDSQLQNESSHCSMPKISSIRLFHRFDSTTGMLGSHLSLLCSASSCVDPGTLGPAAFDWPPKGISVPSGKTIFTPCPVLELAFTAVFGIADASPPAPC